MTTTYCTDVDLLHWEPNLCKDAAFASQTLLSGTGDLAGTEFTVSAGSLSDSHVEAEQVIVLGGTVNGSFPILEINSATNLTLSVLYDGVGDEVPAASPVGTVSDMAFSIRTFWAQRRVVSDLLLQAAGIEPAKGSMVMNVEALRRPCVLGAIQMIYSALAAASGDAGHSVRADLYERLYQRALRAAKVEVDLNEDGAVDCVRRLSILELKRA